MACADKVKEDENNLQTELKVSFPWGLPGLEDYQKFTLNPLGHDSPFCYLQAVRQQEIGLLLINPYIFCDNYEFDLSEEIAGQLQIVDVRQVVVLCTVNMSRGVEEATVNLLAPIIINSEQLLAKQVVLNDKKYSLRTPLSSRVKKEAP
jgi:flagellar assembly factor FliW